MSPAEHLAALPEPMQEQLARIARLAAGMSDAEKAEARVFVSALLLSLNPARMPDDQVPVAEMVGALGRIVTEADRLATERKV